MSKQVIADNDFFGIEWIFLPISSSLIFTKLGETVELISLVNISKAQCNILISYLDMLHASSIFEP